MMWGENYQQSSKDTILALLPLWWSSCTASSPPDGCLSVCCSGFWRELPVVKGDNCVVFRTLEPILKVIVFRILLFCSFAPMIAFAMLRVRVMCGLTFHNPADINCFEWHLPTSW